MRYMISCIESRTRLVAKCLRRGRIVYSPDDKVLSNVLWFRLATGREGYEFQSAKNPPSSIAGWLECIKRRAAATKLSKETDSNPIIHQSISRVFWLVRNSRTASNGNR